MSRLLRCRLRGGEAEIGAEVFEGGGADAFDALEVFDFFVGGLVGVVFLELVAVFDDFAGHGGAEVGEGREIFGGGVVRVELVEEFGCPGTFGGLGGGDARGVV